MDGEPPRDGQHHDQDPGITLPPLVPGLQGPEASALQLRIKNSISKAIQSKVDTMLQDVEKFTDIEKLYLYLKLPTGSSVTSDKSEQALASSSRTQQTHAFHWIHSHLEEHPETSLPKQEVYDEYKSYCDNLNYHPLSAADFGKMMKNVFPNMKARRLGMRGKSKYPLREQIATTLPSPSIDAKQQLQRKIHRKQQEQKLHSPLPTEAQGKRAEDATPGNHALLGSSPAHHSPLPAIGLMVAPVPSPVTVQRSRALLSPSPAVAAENKMVPINLQVVQPVKPSPRATLPSPMGDRMARQRYPQILPKPSATGAITLHPPSTVLLASSGIKALIPACHVSPVNLLQMTGVSLARGSVAAAANPASRYGVAQESRGTGPQKTGGSAAPLVAPIADHPPGVDVEMEVEVIHERSQNLNANTLALDPGTVANRGHPRAASVPIPQTQGYLGLEDRACRKASVTCSLGTITGTILEGGNNISNNESTLHSIVSTRNLGDVSIPNANMSPSLRRSSDGLFFKEGLMSTTTSPRKRTGLSPDSHYSPLKRAFTSRQPEGYADDFRDEITAMTSKLPTPGVPLRPESAPAFGKAGMKGNSAVSPHVLALSKAPFRTSGFQTVAKTQSMAERNKGACSVMESTTSFSRGAHIRQQQHYQMANMEAISNSPDLQRQPHVCDNNPLCTNEGLSGPQMEQRYCQMDPLEDHRRTLTPLKDPLSAMGQAPAPSHPAMQTDTGYFLLNDDNDDVTQDSIVEELVQMEEQMKLNLQRFGPCASFQRQQTPMQGGAVSSNQAVTPFYNSRNSSCTPIQTPTPNPTPTSEMTGGAKALMRESPCSRMAPTTPVDSAPGSSCHTPIGTPTSNCSSTAQASLVECRNPFAFTPINSSITGYHGSNTVSSSPVKPMRRPTATHPDKAKLEWMNESYNSSAESNNGIGIIPSYQDLIEDHFQKPHAFALPGQAFHSQGRHHNNHFGRLTPVSPLQQQQQVASVARREGFAVPAPLDNKATNPPAANAAFRCRSVSPAVGQRNLSGNTGTNGPPNMSRTLVSPQFHSPVAPEMLNIFANSQQNMSVNSMAQRSQSVPVNVMMQTEALPLQGQRQNISNMLLNKMDLDCDTAARALGMNHLPPNYSACMNLSQLLESAPTSAKGLRSSADNHGEYRFQKPNYLTHGTSDEQMMLCSGGPPAVSRQYHQQGQATRRTPTQPEQQQQLDFNTTVKKLITDNSRLHSGKRLSEQMSEHNAGGQGFPREMGMTSDLSTTVSDLNTLDTNLLFDPSQQQGQYQDTTPEDIMNDPLFQQLCSETANASGFDWLESKDHPTVGLMG
ncbi:unnamed protein product [Lota lota]